jgi:hypothetical protein
MSLFQIIWTILVIRVDLYLVSSFQDDPRSKFHILSNFFQKFDNFFKKKN